MISEEIIRLQAAKADIKQAIEDKGVEVSSNTKLDGYAELINDISSGGIIGSISEEDYNPNVHGTDINIQHYIKRLEIPSGVININKNILQGSASLEYVFIPNTVESISIPKQLGPFMNCTKLQRVDFEPNNPISTIPQSTFENTHSLIINNFPTQVTEIGRYAFSHSNLQQFPAMNNCTYFGDYAFQYCDFNSVVIPPNMKTFGGKCCFLGCANLNVLDLSNIEVIKESSFQLCTSLRNITIPQSVTTIESNAFRTEVEKTITFLGTIPPTISQYSLGFDKNLLTIYVPEESVDTYKTASSNWSYYSSQIQPIPTV